MEDRPPLTMPVDDKCGCDTGDVAGGEKAVLPALGKVGGLRLTASAVYQLKLAALHERLAIAEVQLRCLRKDMQDEPTVLAAYEPRAVARVAELEAEIAAL